MSSDRNDGVPKKPSPPCIAVRGEEREREKRKEGGREREDAFVKITEYLPSKVAQHGPEVL